MMTTTHMRCAKLLPLLSALALLPSLAGATPDTAGDYWGVHLGQNDLDRLDARAVYASGTTYHGHVDLDSGPHGGVQLGRRDGHLRYELEYEAGRFSVRHLSMGPINADLDARGRYQAAFANLYRTERLSDSVGAFAGAGIGWGRASMPHLVLKSACTCYGAAAKDGFAWQLRAGLSYRVSDASEVALQFTKLHLPGPEVAGPPAVQYEHLGFGAWSLGWTSRF